MQDFYLVRPGSHLEADARDFALIISASLNNSHDDTIARRQPIRDTRQILAFAGCTIGSSAQRAIRRYCIPLSFIGDNGSIAAQSALNEIPIYSALQQERNRDREFCLTFTHSLLRGRWHNAIQLLHDTDASTKAIQPLENALEMLPALIQWNALQAWHAEAQRRYHRAIASALGSLDGFKSSRSLAFVLLSRELSALLYHEGCSPEIGTFHKHCQNHQPLPCDLMEQFRPVVELWLIANTLIVEDCAAFVKRWENFAISTIFHPYIGKTTLREALRWQVREYVRAITETLEYRPFLLK